jgi:hypothetical protein
MLMFPDEARRCLTGGPFRALQSDHNNNLHAEAIGGTLFNARALSSFCVCARRGNRPAQVLEILFKESSPLWGKTLGAQHETHIYDMNIYSGANVKAKLAQTLRALRWHINICRKRLLVNCFVIISAPPPRLRARTQKVPQREQKTKEISLPK